MADDQRRVRARVTQVHATHGGHATPLDALRDELVDGADLERRDLGLDREQAVLGERDLDRALLQHRLVGEAHPVRRQHARERMHEHARHAERVGDEAGVLAAGAAERAQRVLGHVVAALHRDLLDRVGHVADRDVDEALGDGFRCHRGRTVARDRVGHLREARTNHVRIERLVGSRSEHAREIVGLHLAEQHVAVGDRERSAAAIARRTRVGTGRVGPDAQPRTVEVQDRAAAGRDGVDAHHRRAHPHARDLGLELALELAGVVRDVGRRAAHVEADHAVEARALAGARHADDAAGRTGQDRVLAVEAARVGQAAVRLHELQRHAGQVGGHAIDVAREDRRQIGIDDRRVAARHQLHQRADAMRDGDLRIADLLGHRGEFFLVVVKTVAVHQHDRDRAIAVVERRLQRSARTGFVERQHDVALRTDPLVDLDDCRIQQLGQHDATIEQPRTVLVRDAQRVAKAARDEQHRALALPFEQRVGRDRRAHLHGIDARDRQRVVAPDAEQMPDAGDRGVAVLLGVLGQQLVRHERSVRPASDDVGEGAAAVDPELPGVRGLRRFDRGAHRCVLFKGT